MSDAVLDPQKFEEMLQRILAYLALEDPSAPDVKDDDERVYIEVIGRKAFDELTALLHEEFRADFPEKWQQNRYCIGTSEDDVRQNCLYKLLAGEYLKRKLRNHGMAFDRGIFARELLKNTCRELSRDDSRAPKPLAGEDLDSYASESPQGDSLSPEAEELLALLLEVVYSCKQNKPHHLITFEYMALLSPPNEQRGEEVANLLAGLYLGEARQQFTERYFQNRTYLTADEFATVSRRLSNDLKLPLKACYTKLKRLEPYLEQPLSRVHFDIFYTSQKPRSHQLSGWLNKVIANARTQIGAQSLQ